MYHACVICALQDHVSLTEPIGQGERSADPDRVAIGPADETCVLRGGVGDGEKRISSEAVWLFVGGFSHSSQDPP